MAQPLLAVRVWECGPRGGLPLSLAATGRGAHPPLATQRSGVSTLLTPPNRSIEPYGEEGKYKLIFAEPAAPIGPIPFADAPPASMMGPKYTTFAKLQKAKKLTGLF